MRITMLSLPAAALTALLAQAQPPAGGRDRGAERPDPVKALMAFDANKDGKLTKEEVTDERLKRLFDRADAAKKGELTEKDLTMYFAKDQQPPAGRGEGGPMGRGGPPEGGPGGRMGPPAPGTILPPPLREQLKLTEEQVKALDALQKDVDAKLAKILTDNQKKQMKDLGERRRGPDGGRGPGGPGGAGGDRGPGGPGGRGPGGN